MKIYLPNINPFNIKNILTDINNGNGKKITPIKKTRVEIISKDFGLIKIKNNNIFRLEPSFDLHIKLIKNYNGIDLLVDTTQYLYKSNVSQLPQQYILKPIIQFIYQTDSKSMIKFIVDCIVETNLLEEDYIPYDFYFLLEDETGSLEKMMYLMIF